MLALVPHAGRAYAGAARAHAFEALGAPEGATVFFVGTLHRPVESPRELLWVDGQEEPPLREHSFEWVREELYAALRPAKVVVALPRSFAEARQLARRLTRRARPKLVVVCTADLTHYGPSYGHTDPGDSFPQATVAAQEAPLVAALLTARAEAVRRLVTKRPWLTCGPFALYACALLARAQRLPGRAVDYYTSLDARSAEPLDRYVIRRVVAPNFVSYLAVVYDAPRTRSATRSATRRTRSAEHDPLRSAGLLSPLERCLALGAVKSAVLAGCPEAAPFVAPAWTRLAWLRNGAFVGTTSSGAINCSRGSYEAPGRSLAENVAEAAVGCCADATERWRRPYGDGRYVYKVEVLQQRPWPRVSATAFRAREEDELGVLLELPGGASATYLPSVWRESFRGQPAEELLASLVQKAGGGDWREGVASLYRTLVFTSEDPELVRWLGAS